jgi:hypothetical protein
MAAIEAGAIPIGAFREHSAIATRAGLTAAFLGDLDHRPLPASVRAQVPRRWRLISASLCDFTAACAFRLITLGL